MEWKFHYECKLSYKIVAFLLNPAPGNNQSCSKLCKSHDPIFLIPTWLIYRWHHLQIMRLTQYLHFQKTEIFKIYFKLIPIILTLYWAMLTIKFIPLVGANERYGIILIIWIEGCMNFVCKVYRMLLKYVTGWKYKW